MIKNLVLCSALLFFPTFSNAQTCEDLSGTYTIELPSDYEPFKLIVAQDGCVTATLTRDFYKISNQFVTNVTFDGQYLDEDMFGYNFRRKYFWVNGKAFYEGTLLDSSGVFQANIKGELRLTSDGIYNIIEYYDQNGNFGTRDIEMFVRESR